LGGNFGQCTYPATIDDVWSCVSIGNLGEASLFGGVVLGHAVPLKLTESGDPGPGDRLPATGMIAINNQAIEYLDGFGFEDWLLSVITHEMGHVVSCWACLFIE
jgi:hypothetical protein